MVFSFLFRFLQKHITITLCMHTPHWMNEHQYFKTITKIFSQISKENNNSQPKYFAINCRRQIRGKVKHGIGIFHVDIPVRPPAATTRTKMLGAKLPIANPIAATALATTMVLWAPNRLLNMDAVGPKM